MSYANAWWLVAGALVAVELATGTFYLLMLAVGAVAAALAALAGNGLTGQLVVAALVGSASVVGWHLKKKRHPSEANAPADNLDVGEMVHVETWLPDGSTKVKYRGAQWAATHRSDLIPAPGAHRVAQVVGNRLLLEKI